jgi:nucleoid-associated protein YgaU
MGIHEFMKPAGEAVGEAQPGVSVKSIFYTIKKGDTLSRIAKEFYGDSTKYKQIFKENKGIIKDPDSLYPGLVIRIPREE